MVDELRLGFVVGIITLVTVLVIGLSAIGHPFRTRDAKFSSSDASLGNINLTSLGSTNPEKQLEIAYGSIASEEIERCLSGSLGKVTSTPLCTDNLLLLEKSCQDPQTHVQACENDKFQKYLQRNAM
jgi:hypothetical protein